MNLVMAAGVVLIGHGLNYNANANTAGFAPEFTLLVDNMNHWT